MVNFLLLATFIIEARFRKKEYISTTPTHSQSYMVPATPDT